MRMLLPVLLALGLSACASPFHYASSTGWPIEEPPCCNSGNLNGR